MYFIQPLLVPRTHADHEHHANRYRAFVLTGQPKNLPDPIHEPDALYAVLAEAEDNQAPPSHGLEPFIGSSKAEAIGHAILAISCIEEGAAPIECGICD